jgi:opacity protein-like surface antigen
MTRRLIISGIASALLSPVFMQAQTPSSDETAPLTKIALFKSERPIAAAHKPIFVPTGLDLKTGVGYSFMNSGLPSVGRVNLNGLDVVIVADLSPYFGVTADSSYVRAQNVFGTSHSADVLSYVAGPTLYPLAHRHLRVYIHGLVGGARVTAPFPTSDGALVSGFVNKYSWAAGGGAEYQISHSVAVRSGIEYQHAYFFNRADVIQGQTNFRAVCSIVFSVWQRPKGRY